MKTNIFHTALKLCTAAMAIAGINGVAVAPMSAAQVAIINGASNTSEVGTTSDITTNLTNLHQGVGNIVTLFDDVPLDLSGFDQVWDIRFSNTWPVTAGNEAVFTSFLQGGGGMFLMGENSSFMTRNDSVISFVAALGGGALNFDGSGSSTQTVINNFADNIPFSSITYDAPGFSTSEGSGRFLTQSGDRGTAIGWQEGDLSNAPLGALTVVFDVNFMDGDDDGMDQFILNMITFLDDGSFDFTGRTVLVAMGGPRESLVIDSGAIASTGISGLPFAAMQREAALGASRTALRDVNGRLFRLRAGKVSDPVAQPAPTAPSKNVVSGSSKSVVRVQKGKEVVYEVPAPTYDEQSTLEFFGNFDYSNLDAPALGQSLDTDSYGGSAGVEYIGNPLFTIGLNIGYLYSDGEFSSDLGDITSDTITPSIYISHANEWYYADLMYAYSWSDLDSSRDTGLSNKAKSSTNAGTHTIAFNTGGYLRFGNLVTGPIAAVEYRNGSVDGYSEHSGGTANLRFKEMDYESLITRLGWQASYHMPTSWGKIVPQARVAWERENLDSKDTISAELRESPYYRVRGNNVSQFGSFSVAVESDDRTRDSLNAGAGVLVEIGDRLEIMADYDASLLDSDYLAHFASLRFGYKF